MATFVLTAVKWTLILSFFAFLIHCWLVTKTYYFTEDDVASFARKHIERNKNTKKTSESNNGIKKTYDAIYKDIKKSYPGLILPEEDLRWHFMNAGGWMGAICILHASLTEYILFFGTAVDTVGHSGRYWANVSDTLLTGEFIQWKEGALNVNVYHAGDTVLHEWGEVTGVNFKAGTWMVEYGRGFIPSTLGFALSDTLFSTQDFVTLFQILKTYTKALTLHFSTCVMSLITTVSA